MPLTMEKDSDKRKMLNTPARQKGSRTTYTVHSSSFLLRILSWDDPLPLNRTLQSSYLQLCHWIGHQNPATYNFAIGQDVKIQLLKTAIGQNIKIQLLKTLPWDRTLNPATYNFAIWQDIKIQLLITLPLDRTLKSSYLYIYITPNTHVGQHNYSPCAFQFSVIRSALRINHKCSSATCHWP